MTPFLEPETSVVKSMPIHQFKRTALWLLIAAALLALALLGAWYGLHAWLESAGGRDALAAEISRRAGMPVELGEDFEVVLYPSIGAGGDRLRLGGDSPYLEAERYQVSVALEPLWQRQIVIEEIRLADGWIDFERLAATSDEGASETADPAGKPLQLPVVDLLEVRNFRIRGLAPAAVPLVLDRLLLEDFRPAQWTDLEVEIANWGEMAAKLRLDAALSEARLDDVSLRLLGQQIRGEACVALTKRTYLRAELVAERLDGDALITRASALWPAGEPSDSVPRIPDELPLDLQIRLQVERLIFQDAEADDVLLTLGPAPATTPLACGITEPVNPIQ